MEKEKFMVTQEVDVPVTDMVEITVNYDVIGEKKSIIQTFHKIHLKNGVLDNDVLEIARAVHKELHVIASSLGLEYGIGSDPNLEMLYTCRGIYKTRLYNLINILISMRVGTFTATCKKADCPSFIKCPQKHDLTEELKVLPETQACVSYRKQKESLFPKPYGKKTGRFSK